LVIAVGKPLTTPVDGVTHTFPSAEAIAGCAPGDFAMPASRARALIHACEQLAAGRIVIDAGSDRDEISQQLESLPGIGPWTANYVALRALGDPDVFLPTDVGVRNALRSVGVDATPRAAERLAESWRPWRSYALHHLWASL
jgi:AraC family transcriptional regulator of adaptative response / DNA-3-methyladenine glycosylase II